MTGGKDPRVDLDIGRGRVTLLGTAHVSRASADSVRDLLESGGYDAVAIELCSSRYSALIDPDALGKLDLFSVIREGRVYMVVANLALAAYQQRLADQFGIEPGAEQRVAIDLANELDLDVVLVDREIGITLRRVAANLGWWNRLELFTGLVLSTLSHEEITEDDIEHLKEGDVLETTFAEFAQNRRDLYVPLIDERDRYIAARLRLELAKERHERLLVVLGAGHLRGVAEYLHQVDRDPDEVIAELERLPKPRRWPRLIPWVLVVLILTGFVIGFAKSPELGWRVLADWVLINGTLSALGAAIATAHPLTVLTAFLAAPFTSLNPTIGAGMVTGAMELYLRQPQVGDFARLRRDTARFGGWWRNRVSRVLLIFVFSTLGSAAGTYIAGYRIVERLVA